MLRNKRPVTICGTWSQFGLNFYGSNHEFSSATVSNDDLDTTDLTDIYPLDSLDYTIRSQTQESMIVEVMAVKK